MKKFFFFAAAMFAAVTLNARVINIDLNTLETFDATASIEGGVMTVSYDLAAWGAGGVKVALDNLEVTNIEFDYVGDATVSTWVSFLVYLKDTKGDRWISLAEDLSISDWDVEWSTHSYFPTDLLWNDEGTDHEAGDLPFVELGFMANPGNATAATFAIRNVKITVPGEDTGIRRKCFC